MRLTITGKLWLAFGTIGTLVLLASLVIGVNLGRINRSLEILTQVEGPTTQAAYEMSISDINFSLGVLNYLASADPKYHQKVEKSVADFEQSKARYVQLATTLKEKELANQLGAFYKEYQTQGKALMKAREEETHGGPRVSFRETLPPFLVLRSKVKNLLVNEIQLLARGHLEVARKEAHQAVQGTYTAILIVLFFGTLIGVSAATFISQGIINSVRQLVEGTEKIEKGLFEHRMNIKTKDEISQLGAAFNRMMEGLKQLAAQTERIHTEKLELAKEMSAGAAHEVKNLLMILQQGSDYLSKRTQIEDPEIFNTLQKLMKEAVARANDVVKGLSGVAALSKEKLELQPAALLPRVEEALGSLSEQLEGSKIKVVKEFEPHLPMVRLDQKRMEQAFRNLFLNAIQAMPEGGELRIKASTKEFRDIGLRIGYRKEDLFRVGETAVVVEIEDTGPGIPEEILDKVFDPFFTTRRDEGGTGLGLLVVRNIIEMHGGTIEMGNRPEGGARATFLLKQA